METDESTQDGNSNSNTSSSTSGAGDEFTPITSQDDLNKVIDARLKREREKYADYKDVKAKASRLDQIEEANKTEIDKAMDRVTKAEAEVAQVPTKVADALRTHLVALHKIPDDDAELFLTATDPELLLKQVDRLIARTSEAASERKKAGNYVPLEGSRVANPTSERTETAQYARELFSPS